jgi:hypothetical protein
LQFKGRARQGEGREESSFSEEKEAKRLYPLAARALNRPHQMNESFLLLFFKKEEILLTSPETPAAASP